MQMLLCRLFIMKLMKLCSSPFSITPKMLIKAKNLESIGENVFLINHSITDFENYS